jgi:hypothetical protein
MALWLSGDMYPSYEALDENTNEDTQVSNAINTFMDQPDWDGSRGRETSIGMNVLPLVQAVDVAIGGEMTPEDLLGYSTGIIPMSVSRGDFDGATIQPDQIDALYASQQYGDVGLSSRNETMVAGIMIQQNQYTPLDNEAALSFVLPGFSGNGN